MEQRKETEEPQGTFLARLLLPAPASPRGHGGRGGVWQRPVWGGEGSGECCLRVLRSIVITSLPPSFENALRHPLSVLYPSASHTHPHTQVVENRGMPCGGLGRTGSW